MAREVEDELRLSGMGRLRQTAIAGNSFVRGSCAGQLLLPGVATTPDEPNGDTPLVLFMCVTPEVDWQQARVRVLAPTAHGRHNRLRWLPGDLLDLGSHSLVARGDRPSTFPDSRAEPLPEVEAAPIRSRRRQGNR